MYSVNNKIHRSDIMFNGQVIDLFSREIVSEGYDGPVTQGDTYIGVLPKFMYGIMREVFIDTNELIQTFEDDELLNVLYRLQDKMIEQAVTFLEANDKFSALFHSIVISEKGHTWIVPKK